MSASTKIRTAIASIVLALAAAAGTALAGELTFPALPSGDDLALDAAIAGLARQALAQPPAGNVVAAAENRFRLQLAAGQYRDAVASFDAWAALRPPAPPGQRFDRAIRLELYARAKAIEAERHVPYGEALKQGYEEIFVKLDDRAAFEASWYLGAPARSQRPALDQALAPVASGGTLSVDQALELIGAHSTLRALESFSPALDGLAKADDARRYVIDDVLVRTKEGASLATVVVRSRKVAARVPSILTFTIYSDPVFNIRYAKEAALRGYAGIVTDARGKRTSPDAIVPWEVETKDTYGVIDWISRQPWSDGRVGMQGLSYSGFAQWAAAKHLHPALKTIVPAGASFPGFGLPMQNNVIQTANYAWPFYVADNKLLDDAIYNDQERWSRLLNTWFTSGRPLREIDAIDGKPNPVLQRQLRHPSYDAYWQAMQPWKDDFAKIDIPILTLTGYFDAANAAAVNYLVEHVKRNPHAEHYLVVGPYSHRGSMAAEKDAVVNGYAIDPVARIDAVELVYAWFDHVFRGAPLPALLADRINCEVMGGNVWRHAPSVDKMASRNLTQYTTSAREGDRYRLSATKPAAGGSVEQVVDLADRSTVSNLYPVSAIADDVDGPSRIVFVSEPFDGGVSVEGMVSGRLDVVIDRKDFDFTWALYEAMPDGKYFNLSYYLGRASYAGDMTKRKLLTPGKPASLPFARTPIVARRLSKGSRLIFVVTVNKNPFAQVNYGTGKDVSDESIRDAKAPLHVRWLDGSYVRVPLWDDASADSH